MSKFLYKSSTLYLIDSTKHYIILVLHGTMAVPGNGLCFLLLGGCFSVFITFLDNGLDLAVGTPKRF